MASVLRARMGTCAVLAVVAALGLANAAALSCFAWSRTSAGQGSMRTLAEAEGSVSVAERAVLFLGDSLERFDKDPLLTGRDLGRYGHFAAEGLARCSRAGDD